MDQNILASVQSTAAQFGRPMQKEPSKARRVFTTENFALPPGMENYIVFPHKQVANYLLLTSTESRSLVPGLIPKMIRLIFPAPQETFTKSACVTEKLLDKFH